MEGDLEVKLYIALNDGKDDEVINLCKRAADGPLCRCTIHNSSVLHIALYNKKYQLANVLFDSLSDDLLSKLTETINGWGNTILHSAAANDEGVDIARKLLQKAPGLLKVRNNWGETAVFQASRYGQMKMFEFLADEVGKCCEPNKEVDLHTFFQKNDKTNILHMTILMRKFDIALKIATRYPTLCNEQGPDQMTAFQILACSPAAFRSGVKLGFLKELIYSSVSTYEERGDEVRKSAGTVEKALSFLLGTGKAFCTVPILEDMRKLKRNHKDVSKLAKVLAEKEISWKYAYWKPTAEFTPVITSSNEKGDLSGTAEIVEQDCNTQKRKSKSKYGNHPLILAAKSGCIEIVEAFLRIHPQGVEYLNKNARNVLHEAVKKRHLNIFHMIEQKYLSFKWLIRDIDKNGNSILHMVGFKKTKFDNAKIKNPVLELSEDLILLKDLKKFCPHSLIYHCNNELKTADELFAENNENLRNEAKRWLERTAEHCTVVIVLIATVAFAAAYTVPGGPNQSTGVPVLLGQPFFLIFTMTDVLSLAFALTAVVVFLSILTSSFQLKQFRRSLPQKLLLGFTLLFLSVSMMMVSFAATVILMIRNKERWTKIAVYSAAFFPVAIFVLSYIPLYLQLAETFKYWVKKIGRSLPRCARLSSSNREQCQSASYFTSSSTTHGPDYV